MPVMRRPFVALAALFIAGAPAFSATANTSTSSPAVHDPGRNVTYLGLERNGIEVFLNIPYGQGTSGTQRFRPPRPAVPEPGTTITAQEYGPACPQELTSASPPMSLSNVTHVSEDCLNLNVARPKNCTLEEGLPVMVWTIRDFSFPFVYQTTPDALCTHPFMLRKSFSNMYMLTSDCRIGVYSRWWALERVERRVQHRARWTYHPGGGEWNPGNSCGDELPARL
jgi:hypothetical protein